MYTLFLQNNATKKEYHFDGLENMGTPLFFRFDLDLDELPSGEYTYALIHNARVDCEYGMKDVLLDTVIRTDDGNVCLRDLQPEMGLLKVLGEASESPKEIYRDTDKEFFYRKKK